jgi:hypothetical protein
MGPQTRKMRGVVDGAFLVFRKDLNDGGQPKSYVHVFRMSSESQEMLADELDISSFRG